MSAAQDMIAAALEALAPYVGSGRIPGYVAGVRHRGETVVAAAGTLADGGGGPMEPSTLFRIASLSKPVGGVVALTLVEDGTLTLDDEVGRWLPELAAPVVLASPEAPLDDTVPAERPIVVRDLLTMTAGFGLVLADCPLRRALAEAELMPGPFPPPFAHDEFMARLGALPLLRQPGEAWLYHTCSDVLAVLVARASGKCCAELVRERITEPLGLEDIAFFSRDTDRMATAYFPGRPGLRELDPPAGVFSKPPTFEAFGSGLVASLPDYLSLQTALLSGGGPILGPELVQLMGSDRLSGVERAAAQEFLGPGRSWGLSVEVQLEANDSELPTGSYGWMGGTGTTAYMSPDTQLAGALFTQRAMESNRPTNYFKDFWRAVNAVIANPNRALSDA